MKKNKVTWLIPVKNGMPFLTECLQSIYKQTYKNFEIIIWDNGSDDGSVEELKKWVPNKIPGKLILDKPLENLGECRKKLINESKTELIALIDCDDINHKDRLSIQVPTILSSNNIVGVGSYMKKIYPNGKLKKYEKLPSINPKILKWQILFRCAIYQPTMLLKKTKVLEAKNYNHLQTAQDYDLWLRLIQLGEIKIIDKPLINYRITPKSVSEKNRDKWNNINFNLYKEYSKNFFLKTTLDERLDLWNSISPHSEKQKLNSKKFINLVFSFSQKNKIDFFTLIKSRLLLKQFFKIQESFFNYNIILYLLGITFKKKYFFKLIN